jgi:hypothetical protein
MNSGLEMAVSSFLHFLVSQYITEDITLAKTWHGDIASNVLLVNLLGILKHILISSSPSPPLSILLMYQRKRE